MDERAATMSRVLRRFSAESGQGLFSGDRMRERSADGRPVGESSAEVDRVLSLLREALAIIDAANLPLHIGAYLDHVICEVQEYLHPERPSFKDPDFMN